MKNLPFLAVVALLAGAVIFGSSPQATKVVASPAPAVEPSLPSQELAALHSQIEELTRRLDQQGSDYQRLADQLAAERAKQIPPDLVQTVALRPFSGGNCADGSCRVPMEGSSSESFRGKVRHGLGRLLGVERRQARRANRG